MHFKDIRDYISKLEALGELKRISSEVDPVLEITAIADRAVKNNCPALLFENPKGSKMPILINSYASQKRMAFSLGCNKLEELENKITAFFPDEIPKTLFQKIKVVSKLKKLSDFIPKQVKSAPCQEIIIEKNPSMDVLPVLKCWPKDGGKFFTLPMVFTVDPITKKQNCGMYRMQIYDSCTTGMHWHRHKDGARHYKHYENNNEKMPVSVAIGSDPCTVFSSALPLPPDIDEMMFAGFLNEEPVKMVKCVTNNILVPANAEIILEGYIQPGELRTEGPFGDHTGFYSLADDYPVFHLECITHRKNPIYHATVVGRPPMEDCYMGQAIERLFLPLIRLQLPEIIDVHMPFEGVFHNMMIISIDKQYPGHARKIMHAIWGMGQAMFTKTILVVDKDVNPKDVSLTAWKALNNIDPKRDIEFSEGPLDALDHASDIPCYGSKMGIDATRKWKSEGFDRKWPDEIKMSQDVLDKINERWKELGID